MCDCGRGLRPRTDSPGLGIGLSLMSRLSDGLEITPNRTVGGTRVSAMFRDVVPAGAPLARAEARRTDDAMLREYVAALRASAADNHDEARALLAEARQALGHADHLRGRARRASRAPRPAGSRSASMRRLRAARTPSAASIRPATRQAGEVEQYERA